MEYSSSESAKIYEKQLTRKNVSQFEPKSTLDVINEEYIAKKNETEDDKRMELVTRYLEVRRFIKLIFVILRLN